MVLPTLFYASESVSGFEIYRKFDTSSLNPNEPVLERQTVHISDDAGRIAMLEKRIIGTDNSAPTLIRYVYSNHLQSASLEMDGIGDIISYEEYHPYGTTAFQAKNASINAAAKRYRYTGKERDEESGLYYHGARYYTPWLARWTAIDPMESKYAGMSPYNYSFNNPVMWNDLSGADPDGEDKIAPVPYPVSESSTTFSYGEGSENIWYYNNGSKKSEVTSMNGIDNIEVPSGSSMLFSKMNQKNNQWVLFGFETKEGESFVWDEQAKWYKTKSGKEFDNPWYNDMLNAGKKLTAPAYELMGLENFGIVKGLKEEYNKYDGGIGSFAFYKIKESIKETISDIGYGGNRRSQALLSLWMNANISYIPTGGAGLGIAQSFGRYSVRGVRYAFDNIGFRPISVRGVQFGFNYAAEHGLSGRTLFHFENSKIIYRLDYHNLLFSNNPINDKFLHYHFSNKRLPAGTPNNSKSRHIQFGTGINITNPDQLRTKFGIRY